MLKILLRKNGGNDGRRKVSFRVAKERKEPGSLVLNIKNISVKNPIGVLALKNFSLEVRCGEIVGVAGVDGNGQAELVKALIGLVKVETGDIELKGKSLLNDSIRNRIDQGVAYIPEDRHAYGLILDYNLEENLVLKLYYQEPYSKKGILQKDIISEHGQSSEHFDIRLGR